MTTRHGSMTILGVMQAVDMMNLSVYIECLRTFYCSS